MENAQEFESTIVYKDGGPYQRKGGTFDTADVHSQEELDEKLANGWHLHPDHIGAKPVAKEPESDNTPPTRDELEQKAKELKIKFSDKTSDEDLGKLIAAKLQG